ncbi:MAG: DMT family transporter [Proteobacteria bacterium]|nr:DMT family transporter [Pseudomonadota bacterium]
MLIGILAGLGAGALWGLTFIAPKLVEPFAPFDLALLRNLVFALVSLAILARYRAELRAIDRRGVVISLLLGLMGYSGYYLFVAYSVVLAGPAIAALVIGALPVLLAIAGNMKEKTVSWRALILPLGLIALGLGIVNLGAMEAPMQGRSRADILLGFLLAVGALLLWLYYGLLNASALKERPRTDAIVWTSLQGIGAGIFMLAFLPAGLVLGSSRLVDLPLFSALAGPLWFWALVTGAVSSWLATYFWVIASNRLSVALSAQLIVSETIFGLVYGFFLEARWPQSYEWLGSLLLFAGVLAGIRVLTRNRVHVEAT